MTFDLVKIFQSMGVFALAVAGVLAIMAVASLAVFVERLWVFQRSKRRSRAFAGTATQLLEKREYQKFLDTAEQQTATPLAKLLGSGMKSYLNDKNAPGGQVGAVELARRALERRTDALTLEVKRGFGVLATTGSVAPFVGLLGTVVGIIAAFEGIAREGSGGLGAVSAGIAEALVVTAFGLLVAIPAVLAFNFLSTQADLILHALDQARGEFLDMLENNDHLHAGEAGGGLHLVKRAESEPARERDAEAVAMPN